jgi:hypothetical protein
MLLIGTVKLARLTGQIATVHNKAICCLCLQVITEEFGYGRAVKALVKAGRQTYNTRELWLLEDIKAAQAAVGADVEYQGWQSVPILPEPLPPFGLERPLPTDAGEPEG